MVACYSLDLKMVQSPPHLTVTLIAICLPISLGPISLGPTSLGMTFEDGFGISHVGVSMWG